MTRYLGSSPRRAQAQQSAMQTATLQHDQAGHADPLIQWSESGQVRSARWRSERGAAAPKQVVIADDRMTADAAYNLACQGTGLLWRGDFQNARQMMNALASRADRPPRKTSKPAALDALERFNLQRQARSQRARTLGMLLVQLEQDFSIALRRAPDVRDACMEAYGPAHE